MKNIMVLTGEQHKRYKHDGYLIFDSELPVDILDSIVDEMSDKYDGGDEIDVSYRDGGRIQDAWKISANVKSLARAPKVMAILEELYGRKPLPFQTLNFPQGTEQATHSDSIHFNSKPHRFMCGVWVALEDIDMENGPLVYYPGSHRQLKEVTFKSVYKKGYINKSDYDLFKVKPEEISRKLYDIYIRFLSDMIAQYEMKARYATIKKGQALLWSANLLHGGAPQKDKNRTRHSQVTHYFFENCKYYTPMLSHGRNLKLRKPKWIE